MSNVQKYSRNYSRTNENKIIENITADVREFIVDKIGKEKLDTLIIINEKNQSGEGGLTLEERIDIIIGYALKFTDGQIIQYLNEKRASEGKSPVNTSSFYKAKLRYAKLIDESYAIVAKNISDIFPFADKIHRIMRLNDLAYLLNRHIKSSEGVDKELLTVISVYLKVLDRIDRELGQVPLSDRLNYIESNRIKDEEVLNKLDRGGVEKNIPNYIKGILKDRYKNQLPINYGIEEDKESTINDEDNGTKHRES